MWSSTFISEFQPPELIFVILSYHICGHLLQQPGDEYPCFSLLASLLSLKDFRHTPGPGNLHLSYFWLKNYSPGYLNGLSNYFLTYHLPNHRTQHCDPQYSCPALYFSWRHLIHTPRVTYKCIYDCSLHNHENMNSIEGEAWVCSVHPGSSVLPSVPMACKALKIYLRNAWMHERRKEPGRNPEPWPHCNHFCFWIRSLC